MKQTDTPRTDAVSFLAVTSKEPKAMMRELVDADHARQLERELVRTVKALTKFVEAVEDYGNSGVWPDNYTILRLADEGRSALGRRHG